MSAQGSSLVFNERRGNPHTIGQVIAGPETTLYNGKEELPLYTQVK